MKHLIPCYLLFFSSIAFAQTGKPDTSFTVYSAFEKEKKKYPFITVARPLNLKTVQVKSDIIYNTIGTKKLLLDVF
jgi:pectinesterase